MINRREMLNWFLSPSFDYYNMSQYDIMNVARMMCDETTRAIPGNSNDYQYIRILPADIQIYEKSDFLSPVAEISNLLHCEASKYIKHFSLHGSLADFKYIMGWSDLDTWVVIDDKVFENASSLVDLRNLFFKLNKSLLKIDPIAHHGFIIVLESDLYNYSDSLLPIEVIETSRSLYGSPEIYIRNDNTRTDWVKKFQGIKNVLVEFDSTGVFKHHAYKGKYLTKDMIKQNDGMYQFKYLIGLVMILPSMHYTAAGRPVYKSESFDAFLREFPSSSHIIKCVSDIRTDWEKMEKYPYTPNNIPDWILDRLPSDYILQMICLLDDMIEKIY